MIKSLIIKNLATIEDIELNFNEGFSILTGETGAGKSIIIEGIRLALGGKGSTDLIRTGEKETSIEAVFKAPETLSDLSSEEEVEFFIQRKISEKGTGKGYINGILVPVKKLKEISCDLIDIYGQNDHAFLRQIENQLDYLDCYANALPLRKEVCSVAQEIRKLIRDKNRLEELQKERDRRLDFLDFQIKEIKKAQLKKGEDERLYKERIILKNSAKINALVEEAINISYSQENSISILLARLQKIVDELSKFDDGFKETNDTLSQFTIAINEFSNYLIKFKDRYKVSPEKLEMCEERLSQIENLKRKYGEDIDAIIAFLEKAKEEYDSLSTSQEKLEGLNNKIKDKFNEYKKKAEILSCLRINSVKELEKKIEKEINLLGMKKAIFKIQVKSSNPALSSIESIKDYGNEEVEFLISPNPGEELKPLRKIASGGELSRIMLALKSIGKDTEKSKTLIFDEIDSGIGGKTAEFVARKLKDLSIQNQVICITHLPQIASFANHHFKIDKKIRNKRTFTFVKKLSFEERVSEIAHLLAGSYITETSLKNAREMLTRNLNRKYEDEKIG